MTDDDKRWHDDRDQLGYALPRKAAWPLRMPIIRHVRFYWLSWKIEQHYSMGPGSIGLRTGYDEWVLYAVWRGWC